MSNSLPRGKRSKIQSAVSFFLLSFFLPVSIFAAEPIDTPKTKIANNYFAEQFYMRPEQKISFKTTEIEGLVFIQTPNRQRNAQYSLITDFGGPAMRTRYISGPGNIEELQKWVKDNIEKRRYKGVPIKRIYVSSSEGGRKPVYIVGHRGFSSVEDAKTEIEQTRDVVTAQGQNFEAQVLEAEKYYFPPPPQIEPVKSEAQFQKEEELALRYLDYIDVGNELFGPFQGTVSGEKVVWQSFGETSWRLTNLEKNHYDAQLGFWTNRVVFKGIKAPFNTIDPYVENTVALDGTGVDYKSNALFTIGMEWRPFARSHWLSNFAPWGLPLLSFIKNYRTYIEYVDRKNVKDEIEGSKDHDWRAGVSIFYEWGIELPPVTESGPCTIPDYIRRYVWGEYFGNYYFTHTGFNAEDNVDDFIFNSSVTLGFRLPGLPLPPNPINEQLVLMPYMRFEHVNSTLFSFPFQNRYFVATGVRWMPFNTYRYKDNEWLAKTKVFVEYVGVGKVKNMKQDGEAPYQTDYDLRVGVNISSKRT